MKVLNFISIEAKGISYTELVTVLTFITIIFHLIRLVVFCGDALTSLPL